jgi:N-acetylmuramoyl-L-alanine amidase
MTIIERPADPTNYGNRKAGAKPLFVIYHDTAGTAESAVHWFQNPASKVSAHYIVTAIGVIYRMVPEDKAAWHAGMSEFMGYESLNDWSIGIEMEDQDDKKPYPDVQLKAVLELAQDLATRYKIPLNRHVGHVDIATPRGRKIDPGPDFDWWAFLNVLGARLAICS